MSDLLISTPVFSAYTLMFSRAAMLFSAVPLKTEAYSAGIYFRVSRLCAG
jgi:hypothetical protein